MTEAHKSEDHRSYAQRAGMPDRVWVGRDAIGGLLVYPKSPDHGQAAEYMRLLTRQQLTKLAETEGVELDAYATTLYRICESQQRHIAHLQERIARLHELVRT